MNVLGDMFGLTLMASQPPALLSIQYLNILNSKLFLPLTAAWRTQRTLSMHLSHKINC